MRDAPDASFLLALAAEERDCDGALVRRCRDIASREARLGTAGFDAVRAVLAELCGPGEGRALLARLAADIRAGRFDAPGHARAQVERLLRRLVTLRLEESNPDFIIERY